MGCGSVVLVGRAWDGRKSSLAELITMTSQKLMKLFSKNDGFLWYEIRTDDKLTKLVSLNLLVT